MESKFKVFVIVAIVVLALSIAASTFFVLRAMNNNQADVVAQNADYEPDLKTISLGDSILTNLTSENSTVQRFAKVKISIGVDATDEKAYEALSAKIEEKSASIRNELITTIGEQTYSMLSVANAKTKLADEIIIRLNTLLDTDLIYEVYYEDFFVQ